MECQKHLFRLDPEIHYFNNAYKGPLLKSSEAACIQALVKERNPALYKTSDFFDLTQATRHSFSKIINSEAEDIAIVPSVSYGCMSALRGVNPKTNGTAITVQDEFPSGVFALRKWCTNHQNEMITIAPDFDKSEVGRDWSDKILSRIDERTSVVLISSIHWMNGIRFDLKRIGAKCKSVNARLIIDGTQSVGALPIDIKAFNIDALICGSYKWLFGPYSLGLAYFSTELQHGDPIEESWMNRANAHDFTSLSNYENQYLPAAAKFNVGESSNFILMPMLKSALDQLLDWGVDNIQAYCKSLTKPLLEFLQDNQIKIESEPFLAYHLIGIHLPNVDATHLQTELKKQHIYTSVRGSYLRLSVNVYNNTDDIDKLVRTLKIILSAS